MQIIDADGHVNDRPRMDEISKYMPPGNRTEVFPAFDHIHFHFLEGGEKRSRTGNVGPKEWLNFLDKTGIDWTVVYPTAGLAVGRIIAEDWAIAACRAYNNWLHEKFTSTSTRIKGMALIPIQDADAAVEELNRAVKQLGMVGAMLPSNGEGIKGHFGSKIYWPIYREAEKLDVPLAVHVGALHHLGMDSIGVYYPVHALGHPFGIMAQAAAMLSYGVFDRFPNCALVFSKAARPGCRFSWIASTAPTRTICRWTSRATSCPARSPMSWRANTSDATSKPEEFSSASTATIVAWDLPSRKPATSRFFLPPTSRTKVSTPTIAATRSTNYSSATTSIKPTNKRSWRPTPNVFTASLKNFGRSISSRPVERLERLERKRRIH